MIQREIKRENLIAKYETKREVLKQQLNSSDGYKVKLQIYKKFEKIVQQKSQKILGLEAQLIEIEAVLRAHCNPRSS